MSNSWRQRVTQGMQQGMQDGVASAEQIAGQLIKDKLAMSLAAGGAIAGVGGLGAGINGVQGDSNGNLLLNPFSQAAILGATGGMGGYYGTEAMQDYQNNRRPAPVSPIHEDIRSSRQAGRRGRNAVYGAGAGMLIGLLRQMGSQQPQQEY